MNVKKAVKKITAISAGVLLVGSALTGAVAANLEDFPAPFVTESGQGDVQFVIGSGSTDDYLGALDIAVTLQANAVTQTTVATGGTGTATIADGVRVEGSGTEDYLVLHEEPSVETFDDDDLPALLADGTLIDDDGETSAGIDLNEDEYDYSQEMIMGAFEVNYGESPSALKDNPQVYLDAYAATYTYKHVVEFDDPVDFTSLDDGETIEIAGKTFTVGVDSNDDKLVLFGSDATTYLQLSQPVTITQDGEDYVVEIVGAQSEDNDDIVIIDVNGFRKTLQEGETNTVGGLDIYIKDLFVTNIPTLDASANVFVGSDEFTFDVGGKVEIDGEDLDSYEVDIAVGTNWTDAETVEFIFNLKDMDADEDEILIIGNKVVDPLFGTFELNFAGSSLDLADMNKVPLTLTAGSSTLTVSFENEDSDMVEFDLLEEVSTAIDFADDFVADPTVNASLVDGSYFLISDGVDRSTVLEVTDIDTTDNEITLLDWSTNKEKVYEAGDTIDDSNGFIVGIIEDEATDKVDIDAAATAVNTITLKGGSTLVFDETDPTAAMTFTEIATDATDATANATMTITPTLDSSDDIVVGIVETNFLSGQDGDDVETGLSYVGTFYRVDEDGDELEIFVPEDDEVGYDVFIAPTDATVVVSGGSDGVATQQVNPIAIGVAIRDTDVNLANPAHNLIVVGGTCINSVAAELKEVATGTCGEASGLNPNEAVVELFDLDNGKVAMLVAGWESTETTAAARAVASQDSRLAGSSARLSVSSANDYTIQ